MTDVVVGIGQFEISGQAEQRLKTYGLGSCVAVVMYDRRKKIAGMLHVAYPEVLANSKKVEDLPGYFVDTGMPLFISAMQKLDVQKSDMWIALVGGSSIMDETERFNIGKRNTLAVKKWLWKAGLGVLKEDTGGEHYRNVSIAVESGEMCISNGTGTWSL
jgi:chemotaxis protein CheD